MTEQKQIPGPPEEVLKSVQRKYSTFLRGLPDDERWAMPFALAAGITPKDADVQGYSTLPMPVLDFCALAQSTCNAQCPGEDGWFRMQAYECYEGCMNTYGCGGGLVPI